MRVRNGAVLYLEFSKNKQLRHCSLPSVMDRSFELDRGAIDLHVLDQHILEEDYDENYEPTEGGTLMCGCHGHLSTSVYCIHCA